MLSYAPTSLTSLNNCDFFELFNFFGRRYGSADHRQSIEHPHSLASGDLFDPFDFFNPFDLQVSGEPGVVRRG
ncbi:MAG: hypothetical protein JWN70_1073 [Planctomycetaceae bacterium]|nr:hypothetical protein [Planctomycetaceae bacterium]